MKTKILAIFLVIAVSISGFLGYYLNKVSKINNEAQQQLESIACAKFPSVEGQTFKKSAEYRSFILDSDFKNDYLIQFESSVVQFHYRNIDDAKVVKLPKASDYSNGVYSIAYTEAEGNDIRIVMSIPVESKNSTQYVYVLLSEISATTEPHFKEATANFVKVK